MVMAPGAHTSAATAGPALAGSVEPSAHAWPASRMMVTAAARPGLCTGMDDSHDPELGHLLDGGGAPASAETLRAIVARGRRGRERALIGALLLTLIGGPLVGYLVARSGNDGGGTQQVAVAA